ncbi:MAG: peptidoglycan-binding protein, partial [Rhodanobacteraceae bacterium]
MSSRFLHPVFAVVLLLCIGVSCNAAAATKHFTHHKTSHKSSSAPTLIIRGDLPTSRGLVDAIAQAYEDSGGGRIEVTPFSTISGIDAALNGSADIASSARPGFPGRAQEAGLTFTPVAWDALVLITNPANPVSNLTLKQVHDIYAGEITNWKQVGGLDQPIDLHTIAPPLDGAEFSMRRLLYGAGDAPMMMQRMFMNVGTLEEDIALDTKGLGLSTLSGVHDNKKLKIISIEGVTPTPATVADGSYPLFTAIYLASNPNSPHAAEIAKFMDFLNTDEAKKIARAHDLVPYSDAPTLTAQTPEQQIAAINAKMVSEGLVPATAVASAAPVAAPGATYSHDASVAPTSDRTVQSHLAMLQSRTSPQTAATAGPAAALSTGKPTGEVPAVAPAGASTAAVV